MKCKVYCSKHFILRGIFIRIYTTECFQIRPTLILISSIIITTTRKFCFALRYIYYLFLTFILLTPPPPQPPKNAQPFNKWLRKLFL